jgi:hypothetical protein
VVHDTTYSLGELDMSTLNQWFTWQRGALENPQFSSITPQFPSIDELIEKAQRTTLSCRLSEQVDVTTVFYKKVALRGMNRQRYSAEEAHKVGIIVDYLADIRRRQLTPADAV